MINTKYNRTSHFSWSDGASKNDRIISSVNNLLKISIIITEKLDGSCTSLEHDGCFARTHSGPPTHQSFDGLKALHASVKFKIPKKLQLFGEWLYALHSIKYNKLPGYFLLFAVRDLMTMQWASWEEVELWSEEIQVPTVPILFKGIISSEIELKNLVKSLMSEPSKFGDIKEGVVVRAENYFKDEDFSTSVAKFVRKNHVNQNNGHWLYKKIIKNELK